MNNLNQALQTKFPHLEVSCLKLSEVQKDNESKRIDSEYFKKEYLEIIEYIKQKDFIQLKNTDITIKHPMEIKREYVENEEGILFFRTQNLRPLNIDFENNQVFISNKDAKRLSKNIIKKNDILLTRTGANFGDCAIYNTETLAIASSHILIIRNSFFNQSFLAVFFNTKFGQTQINKGMYGGLQPEIAPYYIKNIYVPLLPMDFQLEIEKLVKDSHFALEQSKELYKEAQNMLYIELGLNPNNPLQSILDFHPTPKKQDSKLTQKSLKQNLNISIRTLKESLGTSGRLDSEYYQSKYDAIEHKIKNYQGGWDCVKTFFIHNNTTCDFSKDKYNYIEISDINISNGVALYNQVKTNELPVNAKIKIAKNDILVSKVRPYRGAVAIIDFEAQDTIASGAFVVLREKYNFKKEVLQVLLRTNVYKEWLLKWNVGTSYPVIKDDDILNLPIPKIDFKTQEKIATLIQESFALRAKAKALLEEAKARVENTIKGV